MCFEAFLANNVRFRNFNEIIEFISNVVREERTLQDSIVLDRNITLVECFEKIIYTCQEHEYIPTQEELQMVWDILSRSTQEDINRLYYKNNLYKFMDNSCMTRALTIILQKLEKPYLDPNKAPKEVEVELETLWGILREYVFYNHGYMDCIERLKFLPREVTLLVDTDSNCIHLDPWYKYVLGKTYDIPMKIKTEALMPFEEMDRDEFGDFEEEFCPFEVVEPEYDYDFYTDEVVAMERSINPFVVLPQDSLRYSIINIMAYILDKLINEAMVRYTQSTYSYADGKKCMMIMKNEFLFKRLLLTWARRNYASLQELQEGNYLEGGKLDVKGLAIRKSTINDESRKKFEKILVEDIMKSDDISQMKVLKELIIMEKGIESSLRNGEKDYYKPLSIKAMYNYADPMRIQGIKAACVWNALKEPGAEGFDLEKRNPLDVVKVNINIKNIDFLKESNNGLYCRILKLFEDKTFKKGITAIGIPSGVATPDWVIDFIDYKTIIHDNLTNFKKPLESIGLQMRGSNVNYTNILTL